MVVVGSILVLAAAVLALAVAGLTLWSGWRAFRDELIPGFRTVPPRPRSLILTALGVVLPLLVIAAFTLYLAGVLVQLSLGAG